MEENVVDGDNPSLPWFSPCWEFTGAFGKEESADHEVGGCRWQCVLQCKGAEPG
jgi:hypothetical protein